MAGHTIWRHWPRRMRGDFAWMCSYCGMAYPRSQLKVDGAGLWVCKEDEGGDVVSLTEMNQALTPDSNSKTNPSRGYY